MLRQERKQDTGRIRILRYKKKDRERERERLLI